MNRISDPLLPDLSSCAREPIHIPGSIQPGGVLLAVDSSGRITHASANAAELLQAPVESLIGTPWRERVSFGKSLPDDADSGDADPDDADPDDDALDEDGRPWHSRWLAVTFPQRQTRLPGPWRAAIHMYDTHGLIELEPHAALFDEDPIRSGYEHARTLQRDRSVEQATQRTARLLRSLLGYDRVMVYRFDGNWNGEVVAESVRRGLEPYLGLHYPATDIPPQARALYLRNRVRTIADVGYIPCPILPEPAHNEAPLDLSDVSLRSVSPVHLEYLSNMGVTATLVASIIINGRLWGLIACHHYDVLHADADMRELADGVASALASRIGALEEIAKVELEENLLTVREKLITAFNETELISPAQLAELAPSLLEVVDAAGVAIFSGEQVTGYGRLPSLEGLRRIRQQVAPRENERDPITGVLHTDALGERFPDLADLASEAAGIIFMPLALEAHSALLWTRREQVHDVRWGGNPYLGKLQNIPGARLSPRQSFSAWQETVRGRSRPWSSQHLESARSLRVLIELMERKHHQRGVALMRASLQRMREGVLIVQAHPGQWRDSPIAFVNEPFARLVGRGEAQLDGQAVSSLLADASRDRDALAQLDKDLQRDETARVTLHLRDTYGSSSACELALEPIRDDAGSITHWLGVRQQN